MTLNDIFFSPFLFKIAALRLYSHIRNEPLALCAAQSHSISFSLITKHGRKYMGLCATTLCAIWCANL